MANSPIATVGLRNVGSYQVSGHPYVTGSTIAANQQHTISFPYVTKAITVIASGTITGEIRAHFHATASANRVVAGNHYIKPVRMLNKMSC